MQRPPGMGDWSALAMGATSCLAPWAACTPVLDARLANDRPSGCCAWRCLSGTPWRAVSCRASPVCQGLRSEHEQPQDRFMHGLAQALRYTMQVCVQTPFSCRAPLHARDVSMSMFPYGVM